MELCKMAERAIPFPRHYRSTLRGVLEGWDPSRRDDEPYLKGSTLYVSDNGAHLELARLTRDIFFDEYGNDLPARIRRVLSELEQLTPETDVVEG
jgi:hypothetical protein